MRFGVVAAWCVFATLTASGVARGHSLGDRFHRFFVRAAFPSETQFAEPFVPLLEKLALRGIDFPLTSTAPTFGYRFNFETGVPERSSDSLGPVFVERSETVGARRFDLGVAYLYAGLTDFDGDDFSDLIEAAGKVEEDGRLERLSAFSATDFRLDAHVWLLSATYGLSDRWDVNVLLPIVRTSLAVAGNAAVIFDGIARGPLPTEFDADAVGVGDVITRTKYRFVDAGLAALAAALALRVPTGSTEDFHGLGDTTVTPTLIASRTFAAHEVHGSIGVEFNADDSERQRLRYGAGVTLQPFDRLAFPVDVVGSSSFTDDEFSIRAPRGRNFPQQLLGARELVRSIGSREIDLFVPRSDIVDVAAGAKLKLFGTATAFAGAIVPLTADGLRADVIPTAELEVSF